MENVNVNEIRTFIEDFCTEVYDMPFSDLELKMDDHVCIKFEGEEYFMPENCSFYTKNDDLIWKLLNEKHHA
jgi:hypothetical protein